MRHGASRTLSSEPPSTADRSDPQYHRVRRQAGRGCDRLGVEEHLPFVHVELRRELEGGWQFRSHTDTEVILAAYQEWGCECLSRFNGMFAFLIYDRERKTFVEVPDSTQEKGRRRVAVQTGISTGVKTELAAGLKQGDKIILQ